jgi:hypothetical protein
MKCCTYAIESKNGEKEREKGIMGINAIGYARKINTKKIKKTKNELRFRYYVLADLAILLKLSSNLTEE